MNSFKMTPFLLLFFCFALFMLRKSRMDGDNISTTSYWLKDQTHCESVRSNSLRHQCVSPTHTRTHALNSPSAVTHSSWWPGAVPLGARSGGRLPRGPLWRPLVAVSPGTRSGGPWWPSTLLELSLAHDRSERHSEKSYCRASDWNE